MAGFKACAEVHAVHKFVFPRRIYVFCGLMIPSGYLRACIRSVCWSARRQKLMLAHLVVFRPGLWWQTTGDKEGSSALQFRTVPTEHLRLKSHESLPCVFSIFWWAAMFVCL